MKSNITKISFSLFFLICAHTVSAGSNNGYTSAANVYTGSSSRTWYGGGVAHVLAEWRKERELAKRNIETQKESEVEETNEQETSETN